MSEDPLDLIEAAAEAYSVDLEQAVCAVDPDPESHRIHILEERDGGYRLIAFGMDAEGQPAAEEPVFIPDAAMQDVGAMFHAASLQRSHNLIAQEDGGPEMGLRDVSEGFDLSHPLQRDQGDA